MATAKDARDFECKQQESMRAQSRGNLMSLVQEFDDFMNLCSHPKKTVDFDSLSRLKPRNENHRLGFSFVRREARSQPSKQVFLCFVKKYVALPKFTIDADTVVSVFAGKIYDNTKNMAIKKGDEVTFLRGEAIDLKALNFAILEVTFKK